MTDVAESSAVHGFAQSYAPGDAFDEMVEADGSLRPHWRMFVSMLDDLGPDELQSRWVDARRLIHDNGITHNVYGDASGLDRPWNLDAIPLLTEQAAWDALSGDLAQRALLLDRLLADLYGPRRTISEGLLPAELIYTSHAFLRPCHGIDVPGERRLHLYAADMVRTAGGGYSVLSDRTQAPFGAGYALENRIVLSRVLPTVFRQCNVLRLAPFFVALRRTLSGLAPSNRDNPRVVLLTPGPYSETYFEHAYLARYLGYTLVQGNDLTVRDARVFLKTLGGLQRVDVIFRRVDDDYCDPLELNASSYLGVPGLLQAVRERNVAVANALGSGVLQTAGFMPYLPKLCRFLLGEDLRAPSVRSWWCGDASDRQYVLDNLSSLVIKSAYPSRGADPTFAAELSKDALGELADSIRAHPGRFVAQEQVMEATLPALIDNRVEPRRFVTRAYLAADGDGYVAMAGGLTRVTRAAESFVVSLQKGGGSKDIWVQSNGPVSQITLLTPATEKVALSRGGADLPSRVADDLYWLGRYVQRSEAAVRLARAVVNRSIEQGGEGGRPLTLLTASLVGRRIDSVPYACERPLLSFLFDPKYPGGLRTNVNSVYRLARLLRDRVSVDAWRILQSVETNLTQFKCDLDEPLAGVGDLLNEMVIGFAAFTGLSTDSMTRGLAYRFLDMGQRVERAGTTSHLLRDTIVTPGQDDSLLLEAVLEVADSSLTYRRRYLTHMEAHAVVDLLLADETNPRSVAFQLAAIDDHLARLPRESHHPHGQPDRQLMLKLRTAIQLADVESCCGPGGNGPPLSALLDDTIEQLEGVSVTVAQTFFAHTKATSVLLGLGAGR
ncbi:MAG TPA: circularly permuted type 2 ATP-grasp protein [Tepidisphaeraceae bacterium]|jgi:uncharacterized circularly permuted ATP-grasp superfamily protein/uncharacterized alpha-E superfamily protein